MVNVKEAEAKEVLDAVELANKFSKNAVDYVKTRRAEMAVKGEHNPDLDKLWKEWLYMQLAFLTQKSGTHDLLSLGG